MDLALYRTGVHDEGEDAPSTAATHQPLVPCPPRSPSALGADSPDIERDANAGAVNRQLETHEDQKDSGLVWLFNFWQALQPVVAPA